MARGRMISKSLSTSEKFAKLQELSPDSAEFCQVLYMLMVAHADDEGRLSGSAFHVKHAVVPTSLRPVADVESALLCLVQVGLIRRGAVHETEVIEVTGFANHQTGLKLRENSKLPALPDFAGNGRILPSELNRTELKGTEGKGTERADALPAPDVPPVWVNRQKPTGLVASHRSCRSEASAACYRGICVPAFLVSEWTQQTDAGYVSAFVQGVIAVLPDGPIGDPPLAFWRDRWKAKHGTKKPSGTDRASRTVAAADRVIAEMARRKAVES